MKRIRKTYNGVVPNGKILNTYSDSQNDGYSCDFFNSHNANVVYKKLVDGSSTDTYTFEGDSLYLLIASTNGNESCIFDVVHTSTGGNVYYSRIKNTTTTYKSISYSTNSVTMTNINYKGIYVIIKLY